MVINNLKSYKNTLVDFFNWCKVNNIDLNVFIKLPFYYQIGVFLLFFDSKGLCIHVDCDSYVISYNTLTDEKNKKSILERMNGGSIFIREDVYLEPTPLDKSYEIAIIATFNYIETPF
jgi:hypothetical protein